jgi:Ala-tRNA(Pro) deacylase
MRALERLKAYLGEHGVPCEVTSHPEAITAQEIAQAVHVSGFVLAKVVMADADGRLVMLVLPAPARVDLMRLRAALGARTVRLAREEEFASLFPDSELGAMPPFGNLYGVPVYLERSLTGQPRVVFNAGTHRETMTISTAEYQRLVQPVVVEFAVHR